MLDIIFNAYMRLYNNLLSKTIVILSVTLVLNILCEKGFSEISWLIVMLSFLCIVVILLNNQGCSVYYTPTNQVHISKALPAPAHVAAPTRHYYEHMPFGTSDPAYQS
jgi:flagellar biosynthesis protein FliP